MKMKKPKKKKSDEYNVMNEINSIIKAALPVKRPRKKQMNWKQAKAKYPKLDPLGDFDMDGFPNVIDCRPFDKDMHGKNTVKLYHGTSAKNLTSIKEKGIQAGYGADHDFPSKSVYTTISKEKAQQFADREDDGVVLTSRVPENIINEKEKVELVKKGVKPYLESNLTDISKDPEHREKQIEQFKTQGVKWLTVDKEIPPEYIDEVEKEKPEALQRIREIVEENKQKDETEEEKKDE